MQTTAWRFLLLMAFSTIACSGASGSEEWPQRPVKIVVPYAAGGNSDEIGRLLAPRLSEVFGQPFIIENRPGASGAIAAEAVARAPADGYTLFFANLPQIAIMPAA